MAVPSGQPAGSTRPGQPPSRWMACRGTRAMQTFFCCGRIIRSQMLSTALEAAYANRLLKGKFPGCVLHIDLPLHQVDVNVHPAKMEVRFHNQQELYQAVYEAVDNLP